MEGGSTRLEKTTFQINFSIFPTDIQLKRPVKITSS